MAIDPVPKLPQNLEAERAVLGVILLDNSALQVAQENLSAGDFFLVSHRLVFEAMQKAAADGQPIDLVILCESLERAGQIEAAGGPAYLAQLSDGVPRATQVAHHARIVKEKAALRRFALAAEEIRESALLPNARAAEIYRRMQRLTENSVAVSGSGLLAVSVEDLLARDIKPREMLLDPILPEQGLAMLYAYRGIGKTHLALGIAAAVASGTRFMRWAAPRPRRVLYIDGELPAITVKDWLAMIVKGIEDGQLGPDALRIVTPDLQERPMPDLATAEGQRLLEPHLAGFDLLVLDNLSALCRYGKENEGEGWLPVQEWALGLRRRGMSVLFIHHAGKNKSQRGTSRREDLLDTIITLKQPADYNPSEGLRCEVHFEKTRGMLGDAAKPFEVRMETGLDGQAIWTQRDIEDAKGEQAAELFSAGMSVRDVADELKVSKSVAHRMRQKWKAGETFEVSHRPAP